MEVVELDDNLFKTKYFSRDNFPYVKTEITIPRLCPHCGVSNNPTINFLGYTSLGDNKYIYGFWNKCSDTNCNKITVTYNDEVGVILAQYPKNKLREFDELIKSMSPGFIDRYNQAYHCEQEGFEELAGIGYRSAMEILIKDYALFFKLKPKEEIAKLNLNRAIEIFFKDNHPALISADVVRFMGNDYTHWEKDEKKPPSLEEIKTYLDMLISILYFDLKVKHPPRSR